MCHKKWWVLVLLLLFGACQKKNTRHSVKKRRAHGYTCSELGGKKLNSDNSLVYQEEALKNKEQEARLIDVPIPMQMTLQHKHSISDTLTVGNDELMLSYKSEYFDVQALKNFYLREMEKKGWQHVACIEKNEVLLIYETPHRICTLSIRPLMVNKLQKQDIAQAELVICVAHRENQECYLANLA